MKLKWKCVTFLIVAGLAVIGVPVSTQSGRPVVSAVSGTFTHGSTVTVSGSAFGTKSNSAQSVSAAPLIWDVTSQQYLGGVSMNAYAGLGNGSNINTRVWNLIQDNAGETARYSSSRPHRHARVDAHYTANNSKLTLGKPVYPNGASTTGGSLPSSQRKFYLSFYRKLKNAAMGPGGGDESTKLMRIASFPSETGLGTNFVTHALYTQSTWSAFVGVGDETSWVRWEMYVDRDKQWFDVYKNGHYHQGSWSQVPGNLEARPAADWRFTLPGKSGYAFTASFPAGEGIGPYILGYDDGHSVSSGQEIDLGEIYYDNTLARVEVSNRSTWDDSPSSTATREVQGRLLSWSSGQVSFAFNQGTFSAGSTVYVYVIDANGNANTNGVPVVIGSGGGGSTPPASPTNLRILP